MISGLVTYQNVYTPRKLNYCLGLYQNRPRFIPYLPLMEKVELVYAFVVGDHSFFEGRCRKLF